MTIQEPPKQPGDGARAIENPAAVKRPKEQASTTSTQEKPTRGFPQGATVPVGLWLLVAVSAATATLLMVLRKPGVFAGTVLTDPATIEPVIAMLAAAVGSGVTTILGYLRHACEEKDWDDAYVPWFVGRPIMGMLLGLIFHFVMKGGIYAVLPAERTNGPLELEPWGVAAVGGLVGLFSKNAIEKLREIFENLFSTKKDAEEDAVEDLVQELPEPLREQVQAHRKDPSAGAG